MENSQKFHNKTETTMNPLNLPYTDLESNFYFYAQHCIKGGYVVDDCDKETIKTFFKDFQEGKSIFIMGGNGSGKTMLLKLLKRVVHPQSPLKFGEKNILDVVLDFNTEGHESFRTHQNYALLYDDVGTEDKGIYYGDRPEVFEKLSQFRYDRWINWGLRTFITTNLTRKEIKERYGTRFYDRLTEQYSQFILNGKSKRSNKNFIGFQPINHVMIKSKEDLEWEKYYNERRELYKNTPREPSEGVMREGIGSTSP